MKIYLGRSIPHIKHPLKQANVVELPHTPCSPDRSPCDLFLFPRLTKHVAGRKYQRAKKLSLDVVQSL